MNNRAVSYVEPGHAILNERVTIAQNVGATAISLEEAPRGYAAFDQGAAQKFVLDPHGLLGAPR